MKSYSYYVFDHWVDVEEFDDFDEPEIQETTLNETSQYWFDDKVFVDTPFYWWEFTKDHTWRDCF